MHNMGRLRWHTYLYALQSRTIPDFGRYSTALKRGEKILIEAVGVDPQAVVALVRATRARGGIPLVTQKDPVVMREIIKDGRTFCKPCTEDTYFTNAREVTWPDMNWMPEPSRRRSE